MKTTSHFLPGFLIGGLVFGLLAFVAAILGPIQARDEAINSISQTINNQLQRSVFDANMPGCKITTPDGRPITKNNERPGEFSLPVGSIVSLECFKPN